MPDQVRHDAEVVPGYAVAMNAPDFSQFHDGFLTGVQLGENMVTFGLVRPDGQAFDLVLSDLKSLQIEDFRQGNIVNYIGTFDGTAPEDAACVERLYTSPHPSAAAQYHEANAAFVARQLASVRSGETMMIVIEPSYGASVVAHCGDVQLLARSATA
jgi:hypothetical protein